MVDILEIIVNISKVIESNKNPQFTTKEFENIQGEKVKKYIVLYIHKFKKWYQDIKLVKIIQNKLKKRLPFLPTRRPIKPEKIAPNKGNIITMNSIYCKVFCMFVRVFL